MDDDAVIDHFTGAIDAAGMQLWYIASDPRVAEPALSFSLVTADGQRAPIELRVDSDGDVMWGDRIVVRSDGTPARDS